MRAALVTAHGAAPRCAEVPAPAATHQHEMVVDVEAAGLHPRVRSQAQGSHYTSTDELPLVPGVDGVGRGPDGLLRYFILSDTTMGSMAEQALIDVRRSVVLPERTDPVAVAAAMNPAMSSWVALRRRIAFEPGSAVLVLGATGNAGRLAIQVAKRLGAGDVVAAARDGGALAALPGLDGDGLVRLGAPDTAIRLGARASQVDVVLDYLWGEPTADALRAIIPARADDSQQLTWIQIGSAAGVTSPLPSAVLRAARLQVVGSGQGSVATGDILAELAELASIISDGEFNVAARAVPLGDVEQVWGRPADGERVVITPHTPGVS